MENEGNISEDYMEIIMQFGYITLFSTVFPLAPLACYICNLVTMSSIMNEFKFKKRSLPEISIGIGQFLYMIEMISFSTVIVNSAIAIYTSDRVRQILTSP
jgi:anoctamin-8